MNGKRAAAVCRTAAAVHAVPRSKVRTAANHAYARMQYANHAYAVIIPAVAVCFASARRYACRHDQKPNSRKVTSNRVCNASAAFRIRSTRHHGEHGRRKIPYNGINARRVHGNVSGMLNALKRRNTPAVMSSAKHIGHAAAAAPRNL